MRRLRMQGMTPAVVYGAGSEAVKLQMDTKTLMTDLLKYHHRNAVVTLKLEGGGVKTCMIGEVQTNPVSDTLVHVDFCEIDLEKERAFRVPIAYEGTPKGVELGGVLSIICDDVEVLGKPLDIPDEIKVDIRALVIGKSLTCKALQIPENLQMLTPAKTVAVSVVKPGEKTFEEDEETEETTETAETEEAPAEE